MKTLANSEDEQEIVQRLLLIGPASERRWGRMTAPGMVCHLNDSFRVVIGEREAQSTGNWIMHTVFKWIGLWLPAPWPHGVKSVPECDQKVGGTPPAEFAADVNELLRLLEIFTTEPREFTWQPHPIFGEMTDNEWMRWGYLHMDHHLRQFGV